MRNDFRWIASGVLLLIAAIAVRPLPGQVSGAMPLPAVPTENPLTPEKIILGKILFWDEQLSSDDTVACGTCHIPEFGGADPRTHSSPHPGPDQLFGTGDDVLASPGITKQECDGTPSEDGIFGWERQVTPRKTPSMIMAAYAPSLFWDGRAGGTFHDPETGALLIANGGALESQAVGPIISSVEMACDGRTWEDVRQKLQAVTPLAFATDLTPDIVAALATSPDYASLFAAAFGSPEIDAGRIGFALASYQRTLISNQSKFDDFLANGPSALTAIENQGRVLFNQNCFPCHAFELRTNHTFQFIGVRPADEDRGLGDITGDPADNGKFRTPHLRDITLRAPYFHNGGKETLADVIAFYEAGGDFPNSALTPFTLTPEQREAMLVYFETLTDPRVAAAEPPFDHPTLRPYFRRGDTNQDGIFDIADPIAVAQHLFLAPLAFPCEDAADANDDGQIDIADAITGLGRLFSNQPPLPAPSERHEGPDPTADLLACE